jgi:hypothetical protein
LFKDFDVFVSIPISLLSNNTCAISIACDSIKHELTKHIVIDAHFTQSQVHDDIVAPQYVPSELQLSDFFTKTQTHAYNQFYLFKLSIVDPP